MHRLTLVLLFVAVPALADDKAKPNTLTPKEIADGWILLFDGETTFGWKTEGDVQVKDGAIVVGEGQACSISPTSTFSVFELTFEYSANGKDWESIKGVRATNGLFAFNGTSAGVPGALPFETFGSGGVPGIRVSKGKTVAIRSVRLRPLEMKSLFNGKDLTGWKVYAGAKDRKVASEFTVTKEGWLNVKNGPGDLQAEGQWADFVVQFDCISNGKNLNSGLFFRCIPDQYQQGYEAQIRNQWVGDDRTRPVDFGTGAIYRRQPARKVVSSDGEWFTMTVAAHGRHIATWVNGYQVTDWTDDRKEAENARQGFKKGKGALSIQGHDPTTDLSFRNIRIQSLDSK